MIKLSQVKRLIVTKGEMEAVAESKEDLRLSRSIEILEFYLLLGSTEGSGISYLNHQYGFREYKTRMNWENHKHCRLLLARENFYAKRVLLLE